MDQGVPHGPPSVGFVGSMNSTASQSNSSGWLGFSPCVPNSSEVLTRPVPKYCCQMRFANARAVVGDFLSVTHLANVMRSAFALSGSGWRKAGTPATTSSPGFRKLPRFKRCVVRGSSRDCTTKLVEPSGHCFHRASIASFAFLYSGTVVRQ